MTFGACFLKNKNKTNKKIAQKVQKKKEKEKKSVRVIINIRYNNSIGTRHSGVTKANCHPPWGTSEIECNIS